jgi:hypothetical protein
MDELVANRTFVEQFHIIFNSKDTIRIEFIWLITHRVSGEEIGYYIGVALNPVELWIIFRDSKTPA